MNGVRRERDASLRLPTSLCTSTDIVYKSKYTRYVFVHHHHHHTDTTPIECIHTRHDTCVHTSRPRMPKRPPPACGRDISRASPVLARLDTRRRARRRARGDESIERAYFFVCARKIRRRPRLIHSFIHAIPSIGRSVGRVVTRIDSDGRDRRIIRRIPRARARASR